MLVRVIYSVNSLTGKPKGKYHIHYDDRKSICGQVTPIEVKCVTGYRDFSETCKKCQKVFNSNKEFFDYVVKREVE